MRDADPLATILLVDDNEAAIELARIMLVQSAKLRCNIISAQSGEEALTMLRNSQETQTPIDLVFLDINMPRLDGFQVLEIVRQDETIEPPPVVMCSTSSFDKDMDRARSLGASGYVEKPPQLEKLVSLMPKLSQLRLKEEAGGRALVRVA